MTDGTPFIYACESCKKIAVKIEVYYDTRYICNDCKIVLSDLNKIIDEGENAGMDKC